MQLVSFVLYRIKSYLVSLWLTVLIVVVRVGGRGGWSGRPARSVSLHLWWLCVCGNCKSWLSELLEWVYFCTQWPILVSTIYMAPYTSDLLDIFYIYQLMTVIIKYITLLLVLLFYDILFVCLSREKVLYNVIEYLDFLSLYPILNLLTCLYCLNF